MKKYFLMTVLALCPLTLAAADNEGLAQMWDTGNTLYVNGDYAGAIIAYEGILEQGYASSKLYYNLGNAYFKDNSLGKAIVNYHRAQRLAPSDKDIEYNLAVANSYIKDRIEPVPEFFVNDVVRGVRTSLSSNVWAALSIAMLAITAAFVLLYMLSSSRARRKAGFISAIVFALLFAMCVSFSAVERKRSADASQAVVTLSSVSVKSSPDDAGKDLFIIHEGTLVEVTGRFGPWTEIEIANGSKGWLRDAAMEYVD